MKTKEVIAVRMTYNTKNQSCSILLMLAMMINNLVDGHFNWYGLGDPDGYVFLDWYWYWFLNVVWNFLFYLVRNRFLNWNGDGLDHWYSNWLRYFHVNGIGLGYWNSYRFGYWYWDCVWNRDGFVSIYWNWDVFGDLHSMRDVMASAVVTIASFVTALDSIYG